MFSSFSLINGTSSVDFKGSNIDDDNKIITNKNDLYNNNNFQSMKEGTGNLVSSHNVVIDNGSNTTKVSLIFLTIFVFIILFIIQVIIISLAIHN